MEAHHAPCGIYTRYCARKSSHSYMHHSQTGPVPLAEMNVGLLRAAVLDQNIGLVMAHAVQMGLGFIQAQNHRPVRIPGHGSIVSSQTMDDDAGLFLDLPRVRAGCQAMASCVAVVSQKLRNCCEVSWLAVIQAAGRTGGPKPGSWLARVLSRKPKMLVAVALANKMARIAWALIARKESYRVPA